MIDAAPQAGSMPAGALPAGALRPNAFLDALPRGRLAENVMHFVRILRAAGLPVGPAKVLDALAAVDAIGLDNRDDFRAALGTLGGIELVPAVAADCHPDLEILHVVRIALIQRLFLLAARLPRFTPQEGVTIDEVIEEILTLDVPTAVAALKETFPADGRVLRPDAFGEPASYEAVSRHSYDEEHHELFDPMLRLHDLVQRVSVCISHVMGAVG